MDQNAWGCWKRNKAVRRSVEEQPQHLNDMWRFSISLSFSVALITDARLVDALTAQNEGY
jgi:hypothetical protein